MICYYLTVIVLNLSSMSKIFQSQLSSLFFNILKTPRFWMIVLAAPLLAVLPDMYLKAYNNMFAGNHVDYIIKNRKIDHLAKRSKTVIPHNKSTMAATKFK